MRLWGDTRQLRLYALCRTTRARGKHGWARRALRYKQATVGDIVGGPGALQPHRDPAMAT
eukprot:gene19494-13738_t